MSNVKLIEEFDGRFRSGNSVPIDRIWLTKEQWETIRKALELADSRAERLESYEWTGVK